MFYTDILPHLASLFLGVASSFFAWWFLQHFLTPKVHFSLELANYAVPGGGQIYLSAFCNTGRRRMLDVEVIARIGIKEFNGAKGWAFFSVRTNATRLPELGCNRRGIVRIYDDREALLFIDPPSNGLKKSINDCSNLDEILRLGSDATVEMHIFCTDSFSGTRRHFKSQQYNRFHVRKGRFKGLDVVNASAADEPLHSWSAL